MAKKTSYLVIIKHITTNVIAEGPYFSKRNKALAWIDSKLKACEGKQDFMLKKV
jgi:hypothetical protein